MFLWIIELRDPEPCQPTAVAIQDDDLVILACQIQTDDYIIAATAVSLVRHWETSFVFSR